MQTRILSAHQIDDAVDLLKNGELVALPTETVYGLAADASNEHAIQKIFEVKGRPSSHPLILHIESHQQLNTCALNISAYAQKLAKHFWPGPLTMVLKKNACISDSITGGLDTIAIRVPKHPIMLEVIAKLGRGIVAPSANAHQQISPTKPLHVLKTLNGKIPAIVDGGMCAIGIESTILDLTTDVPRILRYGSISRSAIEAVLDLRIDAPAIHDERISGNMINHYQPHTPLVLLSTAQIESLSATNEACVIMHYSSLFHQDGFIYYSMPYQKDQYASYLYNALHEIDAMGVDKIIVEKPPQAWLEVNDRLVKASFK